MCLLALRIAVVVGLVFTMACSLLQSQQAAHIRSQQVFSQIFQTSYDQVWQAVLSVVSYPLAVSLMDEGYLESEWIHGDEGFKRWDQPVDLNVRYRIKVYLSRISNDTRFPKVRVAVEKEMETLPGFLQKPRSLVSDGFEEKWILYRIQRELYLNQKLSRLKGG